MLPGLAPFKWSWCRASGSSGSRLDLQSRVLEVEVPLDASPHLVADAPFAPEPEELRTLGTEQFPPETLVCQGAFLVTVALFTATSAVPSLMKFSLRVVSSTRPMDTEAIGLRFALRSRGEEKKAAE